MSGTEYHKIYAPFNRHIEGPDRGKLIVGQWARPEFDLLCDLDWTWTEKINGTNARIIWDGHKPRIGGRTNTASMPLTGIEHLGAQFTEELMEQQFHDGHAVLYGELCGAKMAAGSGVYAPGPRFILFDVCIDEWWLLPDKVEEVGRQMGIDVAPTVLVGSIGDAIDYVKSDLGDGGPLSNYGDFVIEGLVGRPPLGLTGRDGDRLLVKVKVKDFR